MKGFYFAAGSMIMAEALRLWFNNWDYVGAGLGIFITSVYGIPLTVTFCLLFVTAFASIVTAKIIVTSKIGLAIRSIRDDDIAASTSGINVTSNKLLMFVISAVITGIAGSAFYFYQCYINPSTVFSFTLCLKIVLAVVIGGLGTIEGPVISAGLCLAIDQILVSFPGINLLLQGAIALFMILLASKGIMGSKRIRQAVTSRLLRR